MQHVRYISCHSDLVIISKRRESNESIIRHAPQPQFRSLIQIQHSAKCMERKLRSCLPGTPTSFDLDR